MFQYWKSLKICVVNLLMVPKSMFPYPPALYFFLTLSLSIIQLISHYSSVFRPNRKLHSLLTCDWAIMFYYNIVLIGFSIPRISDLKNTESLYLLLWCNQSTWIGWKHRLWWMYYFLFASFIINPTLWLRQDFYHYHMIIDEVTWFCCKKLTHFHHVEF